MSTSTSKKSELASKGWDGLVRLAHWSVAVLFLLNYFIISPDEVVTHQNIGYAIAAVVVIRLLWGVTFAKGANRIMSFIPTPKGMKEHLIELRERHKPETPAHNPFGAIAIWFMWIALLVAVGLGWSYDYTDWGYDNDSNKLHEQMVDIIFYVVIVHVTAVILTSVWLRRNLIKAMIMGRF